MTFLSLSVPDRAPGDRSQHLIKAIRSLRTVAHTCHVRSAAMFRLISTMRRGTATDLAAAWARYPTLEAARIGTVTLLRDDRILRVMIVRNEVPPAFVEWAER